jgi:hypothetical protein
MSTRMTLRTKSDWIRTLYAVCLLGATFNHASMLWQHEFFWDYGGVPPATQAFWTSLTFLDPTAVVLLFLWPTAGAWLTLAIIITDVAHNTWLGLAHGLTPNWMYYSQVAFLAFVLLTIGMARRVPAPENRRI